MKNFFRITLVLLFSTFFLLAGLATPEQINAQQNCSIEIVTPTIAPGQSAIIRISNIPYNPGDIIGNFTFNIYSQRTGRWVDVGDQIAAITEPNQSLEFSILNDNGGSPLFIEGVVGNIVTLRRMGLLGVQQDLCSSTQTIVVTPGSSGLGLCQQCGELTGGCASQYSCISSVCVPLAANGQEGSACLHDDQCDPLQNLVCQGGGVVAWCASNPTDASPLTGTCVPGQPQPDADFNCADRGGQCGQVPFTEQNCKNNVLNSDCDLFDQCWISPNDALGLIPDASTRGSCVIGNLPGCGDYGANCCRNSSGEYTCRQGTPGVRDNGNLQFCFCEGGNRPLGSVCDQNEECNSGKCLRNKCSVGNQCLEVPIGATDSFCASVEGSLCIRNASQNGNGLANFCCPTAEQCTNLGGTPRITPYMCVGDGVSGIKTAIGCVPITSIEKTTSFFLRWTVGIVGGIAMLLLIYGSYEIITSRGDKYKLQSGKDVLLATLSGIFLIIFAIMLLRIIMGVLNT